jgi:hypothetical protein
LRYVGSIVDTYSRHTMNKGLQTRSRGFFKQKPILRLVVALVALFSLIHLFSKYRVLVYSEPFWTATNNSLSPCHST